ncbi:hypothetical protein FM104_03440 [Microbacterium esteraromaticum]|uniref:Uncharacterized protein n=1 Tax=Microbacterium esteraromaticum TaxID=57043 RepID=A0A1R4IR04_9MICO|nr:hypothetical protein [Microbacterium esteraromaticum]SJN22276.1 hypothetical protein FM104_03440 [Microbacterium esteraromaticum]
MKKRTMIVGALVATAGMGQSAGWPRSAEHSTTPKQDLCPRV